jgi:murein DD-endopeptidase MepM/ murein hydrolase activator NlpD
MAIEIVICFILLFCITSLFSTPKEKELKKSIKYILNEYDNINRRVIESEVILGQIRSNDSIIYETIFESQEINKKEFETYYEGEIEYDYCEIVNEVNTRLSNLDKRLAKELFTLNKLVLKSELQRDMLLHIPAIQPIDNKDLKRTASGWGWRVHPIYNIKKFHYGLDFTAPIGTPIYATGDGIIEYSILSTDKLSRGYGNLIIIDHGYGYKTLYAHLNKFNIKKGDKIERGKIIGYVGSSGLSTGPHLHYEVIKDGKKVNPINYLFNSLTPDEYEKIIEISNSIKKSYD